MTVTNQSHESKRQPNLPTNEKLQGSVWLQTQNEILCHTNVFLLGLHSNVENIYFGFKCKKKLHYKWAWKQKEKKLLLLIVNPWFSEDVAKLFALFIYYDNIHQNDDLMSIVKAFARIWTWKFFQGVYYIAQWFLK